MQRFSPKTFSVLEKKIFKGFYHVWAWRPSWSMYHNHFSNLSFPQSKEALYEIWAKLAQRLQRRSRLKMLTDWQMDGWMIIIAHPEHSSGELKSFGLDENNFFSIILLPAYVQYFCNESTKYLIASTKFTFHQVDFYCVYTIQSWQINFSSRTKGIKSKGMNP